MAAVVPTQDIDYLRSLYPDEKFDYLSGQEEQLILHYFRGFSPLAAAQAAGYKSPALATEFLKKPSTLKVIDHLREREFSNINITRDMLNSMLLQAHRGAANSTEQVMTIREMGKMNNLYEDNKNRLPAGNNTSVVINQQTINGSGNATVVTRRQLEGLPDDELMRLAGGEFDFALPAPIEDEIIDVEFEEPGTTRVLNERK